jgi:hypothetical protein
MMTPPRILGRAQARKRGKRHRDPQSASRRGGVPRRRRRHSERARGLVCLTGRRHSGGCARFGATACVARFVFSHINYSRVDSSNAMRVAHAVAPNLAYPPQWRLPTADVKPLARSKCRRRRRGAPPCSRRGPFSCPVATACVQQVMVWPDQAFPSGSIYGESKVY